MKVFILVCLVVVASAGVVKKPDHSKQQRYKQHLNDCQVDTSVNSHLVTKFDQGELVDDENIKHLLLCLARKYNIINDKGGLNVETIEKNYQTHIEENDVEEIKKCAVDKATPEDTVYDFYKCKHKIVGSLFA